MKTKTQVKKKGTEYGRDTTRDGSTWHPSEIWREVDRGSLELQITRALIIVRSLLLKTVISKEIDEKPSHS